MGTVRERLDRMRALIHQPDARSTPLEIEDLTHMWDAGGGLWCYSAPADVWLLRDESTPASYTVATSARSYQRLVAEFGPLRPYEADAEP